MAKTLIDCFRSNAVLKGCVRHMLAKAIPARLGNMSYLLGNSGIMITEEEYNELQSLANAIDLNIEMTIKAE